MRLARAALAAAVALGPVALVALPARAAECVRVVVDYGTSSGANTHCTTAGTGDTAAEVLAQRAEELGKPQPRYRGNFLCAIDDYPGDNECGDSGTKPYWSFWYWAGGRWVYSSLGVDSYTVRDSDRDGHPDPIGFRYHEFETKRSPRAEPSETDVTPGPRATTPPSGGVPVPGGTQAGRTAGPAGSATVPATPAASATTTAAAGTATPGATSAATPEETFAAPPVSPRRDGGGAPVATIAALVLAAGLLGAAAFRFRGSP